MKPNALLYGITRRRFPTRPGTAAERPSTGHGDRWPMAFAFVLWCAVSALLWVAIAQLVFALL
jgi:hypothetical protein